jgi:hypothetical protein
LRLRIAGGWHDQWLVCGRFSGTLDASWRIIAVAAAADGKCYLVETISTFIMIKLPSLWYDHVAVVQGWLHTLCQQTAGATSNGSIRVILLTADCEDTSWGKHNWLLTEHTGLQQVQTIRKMKAALQLHTPCVTNRNSAVASTQAASLVRSQLQTVRVAAYPLVQF